MKKFVNCILAACVFYTIFHVAVDILHGKGVKEQWDKTVNLMKNKYEELSSRYKDTYEE